MGRDVDGRPHAETGGRPKVRSGRTADSEGVERREWRNGEEIMEEWGGENGGMGRREWRNGEERMEEWGGENG